MILTALALPLALVLGAPEGELGDAASLKGAAVSARLLEGEATRDPAADRAAQLTRIEARLAAAQKERDALPVQGPRALWIASAVVLPIAGLVGAGMLGLSSFARAFLYPGIILLGLDVLALGALIVGIAVNARNERPRRELEDEIGALESKRALLLSTPDPAQLKLGDLERIDAALVAARRERDNHPVGGAIASIVLGGTFMVLGAGGSIFPSIAAFGYSQGAGWAALAISLWAVAGLSVASLVTGVAVLIRNGAEHRRWSEEIERLERERALLQPAPGGPPRR